MDDIWQTDTSTFTGGIGDLLKDTSAYKAILTNVTDTVNAIMDTLQLQDGWVATQTTQGLIVDTVNGIIDTLQNHDDWVAKEASLVTVEGVAHGILGHADTAWAATTFGDQVLDQNDTLKLIEADANTIIANQALLLDSLYAVIDSLQNQDDWVATSANQTLIIDTANAILDTLQLYDGRWALASGVDVTSISGDAAVADSLEAILDGTGATMTLNQLNIIADGNKNALVVTGSGSGEGVKIGAGATGDGVHIQSTDGLGLYLESNGADNNALYIVSNGASNASGIYVGSGTNSHGIEIDGDAQLHKKKRSLQYGLFDLHQ